MSDQWIVKSREDGSVRFKSPDGEEFIVRADDSLNIFQNPTIKSIADRMDMAVETLQGVIRLKRLTEEYEEAKRKVAR
jgi:hypothetical protein